MTGLGAAWVRALNTPPSFVKDFLMGFLMQSNTVEHRHQDLAIFKYFGGSLGLGLELVLTACKWTSIFTGA